MLHGVAQPYATGRFVLLEGLVARLEEHRQDSGIGVMTNAELTFFRDSRGIG